MRRLLHRALLAMAQAVETTVATPTHPITAAAVDTPDDRVTAAPCGDHPLDVLCNALVRPAPTTERPNRATARAFLAAIDMMDVAKPAPSTDATRPGADAVTAELTATLLTSLLAGDVQLAAHETALSGPLFPAQNLLTFHTSPYARGAGDALSAQQHATATAARLERRVANCLARHLRLPSRFWWPEGEEDARPSAAGPSESERHGPASPRPALGVQLHTWTPVVVDARGEHHILADVALVNAAAGQARLGGGGGGGAHAPPQLGHGTATEARALFAFQRVASPSQTPPSPPPLMPTPVDAPAARGGGIVYDTTLEAYACLVRTAVTQALTRCQPASAVSRSSGIASDGMGKLVVYASDQADPQLFTVARLLGVGHVRAMQTIASPTTGQYAVSVDALKRQIVEDAAQGLFPCLVVGVFGGRWSGAVDPLEGIAEFCQKTGVWFHVDASAGGTALLAAPPNDAQCEEDGEYENHSLRSTATTVYACAQRGLAHADSLFVSLQRCALPFALAHAGRGQSHAALFLADTAKLRWTLQHTLSASARMAAGGPSSPSAGGAPINGWVFPDRATHTHQLDAFHLTTTRERRGAGTGEAGGAVALALHLVACPPPSAALVRSQQCVLAALREAIHADGRFDASVNGVVFGLVLVRWLTSSDEATASLAEAWRDVLWESAAQNTRHALALGVGVVALQKRLWLSVSLTCPIDSAAHGKAFVTDVMQSLKEAAARCGH